MSKKLTQEQVEGLTKALDARLNEFLDGYVLMGFVAELNEPIVIFRPGDTKTAMALNMLIASNFWQVVVEEASE